MDRLLHFHAAWNSYVMGMVITLSVYLYCKSNVLQEYVPRRGPLLPASICL